MNMQQALHVSARCWCFALPVAVPMHLTAQNTCADLTIVSIHYAAFNDSVIEVVAQAAEGSFFSYPQFSLIDTQNDTLTRENVNFFGIGQGPQTHSSVVVPGHVLPSSTFSGTLLFSYSGPGEENYCTFPISGSLCPPGPCVDMEVFVYRQALPPLVSTSFNWTVSDGSGAPVGTGTLAIDAATGQLGLAELCLPPGQYSVHIHQNDAVGDQFYFGVGQRNFTVSGPLEGLMPGGEADLAFTLQARCIAGPNEIRESRSSAPTLMLNNRVLTISTTNGGPLGPVEILDSSGRCVQRGSSTSSTATMDLGDLACGVHVVRTANGPSKWVAQRVILN